MDKINISINAFIYTDYSFDDRQSSFNWDWAHFLSERSRSRLNLPLRVLLLNSYISSVHVYENWFSAAVCFANFLQILNPSIIIGPSITPYISGCRSYERVNFNYSSWVYRFIVVRSTALLWWQVCDFKGCQRIGKSLVVKNVYRSSLTIRLTMNFFAF